MFSPVPFGEQEKRETLVATCSSIGKRFNHEYPLLSFFISVKFSNFFPIVMVDIGNSVVGKDDELVCGKLPTYTI